MEATLQGFIAFTVERACNLENEKRMILHPRDFGFPWKWVPFSYNKEDALSKLAYARPSDVGEEEDSNKGFKTYVVLQVWLSQHVVDILKEYNIIEDQQCDGDISSPLPPAKRIRGWRHWGPISLVKHDWSFYSRNPRMTYLLVISK